VNDRNPFEYAVLRVVPRVDRGEAVNAGVVLYCRAEDFLGARVHLDPDRVRALDPGADLPAIAAALDAAADTCAEDGTGRAAAQDIGRRFRWLTAPRSTVVQAGPVHTGLTDDAGTELDRLLRVLVLPL
jgi:secreted trypsin-like serine protease